MKLNTRSIIYDEEGGLNGFSTPVKSGGKKGGKQGRQSKAKSRAGEGVGGRRKDKKNVPSWKVARRNSKRLSNKRKGGISYRKR